MPRPTTHQGEPNLEIRGLNWAYVLIGVADGTLLPFIPLFLLQRGLSAQLIGAVLAAAALASLVAGMSWAYLADRRLRPERILVVASAAAALASLLLALTKGALVLAAVIVVLWLARAPFMLLDPITLRRLRKAPRTDYARIRLRMSAGWAGSVTLSGAVFQVISLRLMPFVYAPLTLLFGMWVWRFLKPVQAIESVELPPLAGVPRRVPKVPVAMVGFLASAFLLGASLAATQNFLTLRISFLGGGALIIGAAAAFQALTEIPTMGYTHVLTRRLSHRGLYAIGCAVYVVVFIAWAFVSDAFTAALLKLAVGVAFALTYVASVVIADELSPAHLRATGQALMKSVLFGLAPIAGSLGGGLIYGTMGPRAMFLISTVAVAAAGLMVVVAVPDRARRSAGEAKAPAAEPVPVTP
ncbi:MAG: MFS transporter [Chloroflexi bacterium]|nr:MAG: MFS transporter [Chloroflexota bacterium]TME37997.1 MAG: MFS transporter [Chloroflexota bacterium]